MSKPENVIQKKKKNKQEKLGQLREETDELADRINGNPAVVKAIRKLEERLEVLENEIL